MTVCPHTSPALLHHAPIPCDACHGWLDHDGSVMTTPTMLARYPQMRQLVRQGGRQNLPDYEPSTADGVFELVRIAGALARTLLAAFFALIAIAIVVWLLVQIVK